MADDSSWSFEPAAAPNVRPVHRDSIEPRITSVPVSLIVGGMLMASLGITQRIRRARDLRV